MKNSHIIEKPGVTRRIRYVEATAQDKRGFLLDATMSHFGHFGYEYRVHLDDGRDTYLGTLVRHVRTVGYTNPVTIKGEPEVIREKDAMAAELLRRYRAKS